MTDESKYKPLNKVLPSYKGNCDCVFVPEMPMTEMFCMRLNGEVVTKGIGSQLSSVRIKAGSGKLKRETDLFYFS